jgi:uncharacterized repeat protein (TIGR02543 family)
MNLEKIKVLFVKYRREITIVGVIILLLLLLLSLFGGRGNNSSSSQANLSSANPTSQISTTSNPSSGPIVNVTITFNGNGGILTGDTDMLIGASGTPINQARIPGAVRTGYAFGGWSLVANSGEVVTLTNFPNANTTYFAVWTPDNFDVRFVELTDSVIAYDNSLFGSIAVTASGRLLAMGRNSGFFGSGATSSSYVGLPQDITINLGLAANESVVDAKLSANNSEFVIVLTSNGRVLTVGENVTGKLGTGDQVNKNVYQDITSNIVLNPGETISDIMTTQFNTFVWTSQQRLFGWGTNNFLTFSNAGNGNFQLVPLDLTSNLTAVLNPNETIDWIEVGNYAGIIRTSQSRYLTWGTSDFATMLFQPINSQSLIPLDITNQLNTAINNEAIVEFRFEERSGMFITETGKVYDFGDGRNIFFANTTDRPDYQQFWGSSTPFLINTKLTFNGGEVPVKVGPSFFFTNQNRMVRLNNGNVAFNQLAMANDDTILLAEGILDHFFMVTTQGKIIVLGMNSTGILGAGTTNTGNGAVVTANFSSDVDITTLSLPFASEITYAPTRQGFTFLGWFTDRNLANPFTGTVPSNDDLVLYTRFTPNN